MEELKNEVIKKSGFLLYSDYWEKYFSKMTGEQIKETFRIIFHFNKTFETLSTTDLAVEMVIATILDSIKRDALKRIKQSQASKENGRLGGRPKKNLANKTKTRTIFAKPTIEEVSNYCLERKNNVDAALWFDHYASNGWKVGKNSMVDWRAAVRKWEKPESKNSNIEENDEISKDINKIIGNKLILRTFKDGFGGIKLYVPSENEKTLIKSLEEEKRNKIKLYLKNKHNLEIKVIETDKKTYEKK